MLIELPIAWVVALNVGGWLLIQFGLAWLFTRLPVAWFNPGPARRWEQQGRFYERVLAIKAWKDHLPDAARWFTGGFAKGTLDSRDPAYWQRFIRETWRGELCHWMALAWGAVVFPLEPVVGRLGDRGLRAGGQSPLHPGPALQPGPAPAAPWIGGDFGRMREDDPPAGVQGPTALGRGVRQTAPPASSQSHRSGWNRNFYRSFAFGH